MRVLATVFASALLIAGCTTMQDAVDSAKGKISDVKDKMTMESLVRETGATIEVRDLGDISIHSYLAPQKVFANNTHIIESANSLVVIDTQFLLPNAMDFRAYADSLGKPIDRVFITHEHPDHFLGSQAFEDVDVYALAAVADKIAANGQAEIDEKSAQFGPAIATRFVSPQAVAEGPMEIDGVSYMLELVQNAEAEIQLVTKLPDYGVVSTGDITYSDVHLILAGQPPTWIEALSKLATETGDYNYVLPGHGDVTDPSVFQANIDWLAKAGELMGTAKSGAEFKAGMIEAFPDLGMPAAIDFVLPYLFPPKS